MPPKLPNPRQCFTLAEKVMFQQLELEEEEEEDTKEIDGEEFQKALQRSRIARARTRLATEAEENNLEIAAYLNRIISKTNEETKMDSRRRNMEETSIPQSPVNRDMENRYEESGINPLIEADTRHKYNSPVDQLAVMDNRVEEEHSQMANAHRAGDNNGDVDIVGNSTSGPVKQWVGQ